MTTGSAYRGLVPYYGDLHNHCAIGYGHGSIQDSFRNARLQLDFACVTAHSAWGDIPADDPGLADVVEYHQRGFQVAAERWEYFRSAVEEHNEPGRFVTFLGFEWHSMAYGDHHVLYKSPEGEIIHGATIEDMRAALRDYHARGIEAMLFPHHIGYKRGYRGINWDAFTPEFSPVVEIMSMHGASESDEAPYPFLHTMGPRDYKSTLQYGLGQGHVAGVVGSTDHHSAHPGSYGHGRLGLWANALTRDGIWEAFWARRTYALTGDRIELRFVLNDAPLGSVLPAAFAREIEIEVTGGDDIDYVELLRNNAVIRRWNPPEAPAAEGPYKVHFEVGWGERGQIVDWEGSLEVTGGNVRAVEPRFRGHEIVAPQAHEEEKYAFSDWKRLGDNRVEFATRTWGNPTTTTASTQGLSLEIDGDAATRLRAVVNGKTEEATIGELLQGARSGYLGGFLTPAYWFHRAAPRARYYCQMKFDTAVSGAGRDWYYVRVRQKNNQYAWSSPIWVG